MRTEGSRWRLVGLVLLLLLALRLTHLDADFPSTFPGVVPGTAVEEGYKVADAKHRLLWGEPRLEGGDLGANRGAWIHWPYYLSLRVLGNHLQGPRLINVAWSLLLLLAFVWGTHHDYSPRLVLLGLGLLGLQATLFHYGKIATEIQPMTTMLYGLLFAIRRIQGSRQLFRHGLWLAAVSLVLTLAVSWLWLTPSLVLYLLFVLAGLVLAGVSQLEGLGRGVFGGTVLLALGLLVWLLASRDALVHLSLERGIGSLFLGPLHEASFLLVAAGLLAAATVLLVHPRWFVQDSVYRASLLLLVLVGPFVVGCFKGQLRYFAPLLPAYVLLTLEWLAVRVWLYEKAIRIPWGWKLAGYASLLLLGTALGQCFNELFLSRFQELPLGAEPGLSKPALLGVVAIAAILSPLLLYRMLAMLSKYEVKIGVRHGGKKVGSYEVGVRNLVLGSVLVLLGLSLLSDGIRIVSTLVGPSHESSAARLALRSEVPGGSVVVGDWAPYLALGSDLLALPVVPQASHGNPDSWPELESPPSHFLASGSNADQALLRALKVSSRVELGPSKHLATYWERHLELYTLVYLDSEPRISLQVDASSALRRN